MRRAVYPGSFDPVTNGHVDIIERALALFDELVVAVVANPNKRSLFTLEERREMIASAFEGRAGLRVVSFEGLLVKFVESQQAHAIVKGLRAVSDFDYEFQMALLNRRLAPHIDTVFLMTQDIYAFLSSSSVREIASLGGSVHGMVPPVVEARLAERFGVPTDGSPEISPPVERD
ncbi:MAG: pantetheine-phosphate adenylyltransferase [Proteobacteria bacterium]|nr:pantetheine-phosphate adenylyltransferase [Pseudomonadota bacterium]